MPSKVRSTPWQGTVALPIIISFVSRRHRATIGGPRDQTNPRHVGPTHATPDDRPLQGATIAVHIEEPRWASNTCTMQGWMSTRRLRPRAAFRRFPSAANYQTCDHPNMTASAGPPPSAAHAAWSRSRGGTPQNSSPLNDSVTDNRTASARSGEADKEAVVRGSGCQPGGSSSLNPSTQAGVRLTVMRLTGAMRADDGRGRVRVLAMRRCRDECVGSAGYCPTELEVPTGLRAVVNGPDG